MKSIAVLVMLLLGAVPMNAQSIEGLWNTGNENTLVDIQKANDTYQGTISASDNSKVAKGKLLVKNVVKKGNTYKGKIYAIKRGKWYDAEFKPKNEQLLVTVLTGFGSKIMTWNKHQ